MTPSNFYAILNGDRQASLEMLNRILSGIKFEATCYSTIVIQEYQTGQDANDANSLKQDDELPFDGTEPIDWEDFQEFL